MSELLRVAVVGLGNIHSVHRDAWQRIPEARVVAVCDIRSEKAEEAAKAFGCTAYTDFEEMMAKEDFGVLDITLPTFLHAQYALRALNAGKHVICEKPVSLNRADVAPLYEAAEKNSKCFMVAHCVRFWPEYEAVKKAFDSGCYGKLLSGHMERLSAMSYKSWNLWMHDCSLSGLVPYDLHIHDLDFLVYTLGRPEVMAANRSYDETQDYLQVMYRFGDCVVTAEAAEFLGKYHFRAGFRFQFEKAVMESKDGILTIYQKDREPVVVGLESDQGKDIIETGSNAYFNEIRYFTDCVLSGRPCDRIKPGELLTVLETLEGLTGSAQGR